MINDKILESNIENIRKKVFVKERVEARTRSKTTANAKSEFTP